jgi:type II secretory pathway component GspD/PulD (secretin)
MLGSVLVSNLALAGSFAEQCPEIAVCAKAVGDLLGQKYIFDADVKGQVKATPNLELTKENAELLFTNALNMNGFSRVPLGANTYQIMRQRDARDSAIPSVTADAHTPPALPDNWDLYTMKYKATNPDVVEDIARMTRSFMPGNSRIIPAETSGMLLITDTAANLKKVYGIIKDSDVKPTLEMKKKWQEREKHAEQRRMLEAQNKKSEES